MAPDPEVTLKEFIDFRFNEMGKRMDRLEEKVESVEKCINNDVKHTIKMWRYIGGLVIGVLLALAVAWLKQRLGL